MMRSMMMMTMHWMQYRECQLCQDRRQARSSTLPARPCPNVQTYSMLGQVETHSINSTATNKNHYYHWRPENHLYHFRDLRAETSRPSFSSRESSFDSSASFRPMSFTWHRMCAVVIILKIVMMISRIDCCCHRYIICCWMIIVMLKVTSLTIAVKFLTSLSSRRLSRSNASAFSVLAWTLIIQDS